MDDVARAIAKLERWHRDWEIRNRARLVTPMFATEHEVTHEHDWTFVDELTPRGNFVDRCDDCGIYRMHVDGTPTLMDKLYAQADEATRDRVRELPAEASWMRQTK